MSFRFSIDGKVFDIVNSSQSGEVIHQHGVHFRHLHEASAFVDKLLVQNPHQLPELQHFLSLSSNTTVTAVKDLLIDQLKRGQLKVQSGSLAHIGGPARAPSGASRRASTGPKSKIYSDAMLRQLNELSGKDIDLGNANPKTAQGAQAANSARESPQAPPPDTHYKLCVEVAGRSRCFKQRLEINAINGGKQAGYRKQLQSAKTDHKTKHRCLVEFTALTSDPRDLTLVISASGANNQIRLPLLSGHPTTDKKTEKDEWDTVIIPIKPLAYINKERNRQQADILKPGYVYVFWKGQLWRELEVNQNQSLRDINTDYYRRQWKSFSKQAEKRQADGHWLSEIWLPYKLNGADQSSQLWLLYSEMQLDYSYIESLENDSALLAANATQLNALSHYSKQKNFHINSGDVGPVATALLDQAIDPALGYQILSKKGHHLDRLRVHNLPAAYLTPNGEKFLLKVEGENGQPFINTTIHLKQGETVIEARTDANGVLEIPLQDAINNAELALHFSNGLPPQRIPFQCGGDQLEDVSTVKGQQLRLNNLGFNAGVVDGINGRKTQAAAQAFQKDQNLAIDGIIGPKTQAALKQAYGQ